LPGGGEFFRLGNLRRNHHDPHNVVRDGGALRSVLGGKVPS